MRIALFAVVVGVVFAFPASGQIALQISYEHDSYGWDDREDDRHLESGVIYFTDDGRIRHDRTMGTGERVSDVKLPGEYTLAVNHEAQTVIRGRPGAVIPIPGLARQPYGRPNFDDSLLSDMGRFLEAVWETVSAFTAPGSYEIPGGRVTVSEPLGIQMRWGVPLHGYRIDRPANGDRPAMYVERWYYRPSISIPSILVEKTEGIVGGKVLEQRRATDIRQVSVDADLFSVPDGYQLLDWNR